MPVGCWFKKLNTQPPTEGTQVSKIITPENPSKCAFIEVSVECFWIVQILPVEQGTDLAR